MVIIITLTFIMFEFGFRDKKKEGVKAAPPTREGENESTQALQPWREYFE